MGSVRLARGGRRRIYRGLYSGFFAGDGETRFVIPRSLQEGADTHEYWAYTTRPMSQKRERSREINMKSKRVYIAMLLGAVAAGMVILPVAGMAAEEEKSIGTVAGEAARDVSTQATETYVEVSQEAGTAAKEIKTQAEQSLDKINQDFQVVMQDFQKNMQIVMQNLQKELEKFNQALNKPAVQQ